MLIFTLLSIAQANTWTVDPSGHGDATTIADGVALLTSGDTLNVAAGTYDVDSIRLNADNVVIQGAGTDRTYFDGSASNTESGDVGLVVLGESVEITGITFQRFAGVAIELSGSILVQDCAFVDNAYGVQATYGVASSLSFSSTAFSGNYTGLPLALLALLGLRRRVPFA